MDLKGFWVGRGSRIIGDKCLKGEKGFYFPRWGLFLWTHFTLHAFTFFLVFLVFRTKYLGIPDMVWRGDGRKKFRCLFFLKKNKKLLNGRK